MLTLLLCLQTHGTDYIEWKCRFCCKLATFFCGGKCHFCNDCHSKPGTYVDFSGWKTKPGSHIPKCKGPSKCPLGGTHKPNGEEAALGCAMCRANAALGEADDDDDDELRALFLIHFFWFCFSF